STGNATWTSTGNGTGTWTSPTGSGTWSAVTGTATGTGTWGTGTGTTNNTSNLICYNKATNYPACTIGNGPDYPCLNGATNPPLCTANPIRCTNGATNYPACTTKEIISRTNNPLPSVNISANPLSVASGGSSTISWTSNNATSCNAGDGHGTGKTGSFNTGALTESKSFFVTCTGDSGTGSDNVYVFVNNGGNNINIVDPNTNDKNTGDWGTKDKGRSGTWTTGTGSGTWTTTKGTGGTEGATWVSTGKDKGTWSSPTGSGTWKTTKGTVGAGNTGTWGKGKNIGILNTTPLKLGQTATPPWDAIVRYHEGIETVLMRQIMGDITFAKMYGYKEGNDLQTFAWDLSDAFAKKFGYINTDRKEIRVSVPDRAAYQLQLIGDKLTIYEYFDYKIVDVRNLTTVFKSTSGYEYYFQK
ncbi:MAG: hypothetical protein WC839_02255, partial [Candidatus Paceibacterota bacterium]